MTAFYLVGFFRSDVRYTVASAVLFVASILRLMVALFVKTLSALPVLDLDLRFSPMTLGSWSEGDFGTLGFVPPPLVSEPISILGGGGTNLTNRAD